MEDHNEVRTLLTDSVQNIEGLKYYLNKQHDTPKKRKSSDTIKDGDQIENVLKQSPGKSHRNNTPESIKPSTNE